MNSFNQSESKHNSVANIARGVAVSFMAGAAALSLAGCNGNKTASAEPGNGGNQPASVEAPPVSASAIPEPSGPSSSSESSSSDAAPTTNADGVLVVNSISSFTDAVKRAGWKPCQPTDGCNNPWTAQLMDDANKMVATASSTDSIRATESKDDGGGAVCVEFSGAIQGSYCYASVVDPTNATNNGTSFITYNGTATGDKPVWIINNINDNQYNSDGVPLPPAN